MTWIDVSHWNGVINWPQVRASGVTHTYIKASEATTFTDNRFAANWAGAKAVGIQRGAYHFFRGTAFGEAQSQHFANVVGVDQGELRPAVDVESGALGVTRTQFTTRLQECLVEVARLFKRMPAIYTSKNAWEALTTKPAWVADYPLWLAAPGATVPPLPAGAADWWLHQYDWSGDVPGIGGDVDLDRENAPATPPGTPPDDLAATAIAGHAYAILGLT